MSIKERLIQFVLRGKDELSPEAKKSAEALEGVRQEAEVLGKALDSAKDARGLVRGLGSVTAAADRARADFERAEKRAAELRKELDATPNGLADSLRAAKREASRARSDIAAAAKQTAVLNAELAADPGDEGLAESLREVEKESVRASANLDAAEELAATLRKELEAAPSGKGLVLSLREAEKEAARAAKNMDGLAVKLGEQEAAAKAAGIDTSKLADEEKRLAAEVDKAKQALAGNGEQLKVLQREQAAAARATAEHTSRLESARQTMSARAKQVLVFAAAYVSLSAAFGLVQKGLNLVRDGITSMLQTGDQFELLDKRMASLMGSVAGGERATAWIKDFAKNTPLEVADVTEAFALLKSYGLDPMDGALQAVVDKNEQLGGGMERLTGISSALGQAYAKQKLQTEEILQLVERGVPVWGLLEKVTGKNAAQLQKLATEGRLGKDVIKALIAEMGKSAQGAAADSMTTLTGRVSNLKDVWSDFLDRVSNSGALDFVKNKLGEVAAKIDQMDKDGSLDRLAKALSDTFVNAAKSIEQYIKRAGEIDFAGLAEQASTMAKQVGPAIDQALKAGQYTTATLTTVWNTFSILVTSTAATLVKGVQLTLGSVLLAGGQIAGFFGGSEIKASAEGLYTFLGDLSTGYGAQAKTDLEQIGSAWDFLNGKASDSAKQQADVAAQQTGTVKTELEQQRMLNQAHADNLVANQQRVVDAAASGKTAIVDMADAINLIDTTKTTQQVEGLRTALFKAYQDGKLSLDQYQQASGLLSEKLKALGGAAGGAADLVSDLDEKLGDLASVQAAISNAKTDVDIRNITAALRKLYGDGKITAAQYNEEVKKASDQQKELKKAVTEGKKAQDDKNDSDKEAIKTSEDLRRESGKRMEEERRASGEAMERNRKDGDDTKRDMGAMEDFFGGVMTRAREPLAAMSAAALEAFDKLSGISTVDLSLDTGSLEETTASLEKATTALGQMQAAASTVGMSGLGTWMTTTAVRSQRIQVQFLEQKAALQELTEGYEAGSIGIQDFVEDAEQARSSLNLLNDSDLRTLEGAIEGARQKMQQLQEGSKSTLTSLREELMGLRGETEDLERSKFAGRRAELQQQIADAQKAGDPNALNNLQQAMATLRQIESETTQKRQQDEQQKRVDAAKATPAAQTQAPAKIIRLQPANGPAVDVAVQSDTDETNLLGVLESAGLRSL